MANPNYKIDIGIRNNNPCKGCTRDWKKPGCHDTCPDRKPWLEELQRVNAARKEYDRTRYNKYLRD
jgi:hypothetical protein